MIDVEPILDSISPHGERLLTFRLRYPKFIHGEFMTHRVFSRNASSSRALPIKKVIAEVMSDTLRAAPVFWGAEQKGMSPGGELNDETKRQARMAWATAAGGAVGAAQHLMVLGVHKSIVNRVLEPFVHINVIVTATEYENFFGLRLDKNADPTMRALAGMMWDAYKGGNPTLLTPGQWHLPFVDDETMQQCRAACGYTPQIVDLHAVAKDALVMAQKVSVARCARVSYMSFDTGQRSTIEEDLGLYQRLVGAQPLHASPAEHQATPDEYCTSDQAIESFGGDGPCKLIGWQHPEEHGNFTGWRQYRKMLPGEAIAPLPPELEGTL